MSDYQKELIALLKGLTGQANILTIPRAFIDLSGDLKAALFLWECVNLAERSQTGVFARTYQEWQAALGLSRAEIDRCRKQTARWVTTELRQQGGAPVLRYAVDLQKIVSDLGGEG